MDSKKKYRISGLVVHGDGYGRKIGFPTVNLDIDTEATPPYGIREGVYSGLALLDKKTYRAGIVVSNVVDKNIPKIEAHLIDYTGDAYGKNVVLEIQKFIREYKNFETEEELINQIKEDLNQC
ncbi:MAG: riboflavin kinase [Patescibacteria group bacterium]